LQDENFFWSLRSGFGFLSTIPVGITMEGIENLMKHILPVPGCGAAIGIILAVLAIVLTSLVVIPDNSFIIYHHSHLLSYRIHHIDGLADLGMA